MSPAGGGGAISKLNMFKNKFLFTQNDILTE